MVLYSNRQPSATIRRERALQRLERCQERSQYLQVSVWSLPCQQSLNNFFQSNRAAQTYSIPRKTLRNWMKRLHIKSQFPMPKQLKQAAERKKNSSQVKDVIQNPNIIINAIELS